MPGISPRSTITVLRPDLGGAFEAFDLEADRLGFIGARCLPPIEVALQATEFGKSPLADLLKKRNTAHASGAPYSRNIGRFDKASYATEEHGHEEIVPARDERIYGNIFDAEMAAAARARDAVMRSLEVRIKELLFNTTTWTGSSLATTVGTSWATVASATPIADVEAAARKVYAGSGLWPNALIISRTTFRNLRLCAEIIARIASSGAGNPTKASDITAAMLAQVFDLDMVLVGGGSDNTANENQTPVVSEIWGTGYAMVARVAKTSDIREPCVGRVFHWSEDGSNIGGAMEHYFDEQSRSHIIRCRCETDEVVLYPEAAHLLDIVP